MKTVPKTTELEARIARLEQALEFSARQNTAAVPELMERSKEPRGKKEKAQKDKR